MQNERRRRRRQRRSFGKRLFYLWLLCNAAAVAAAVIVMRFSLVCGLVVMLLCLAGNWAVVLHRAVSIRVYLRFKRAKRTSQSRLNLIRDIMDLLYTHSSDTDIFYRKVSDRMRLDELKDRGVIDFHALRCDMKDDVPASMKEHDREFYCLLNSGFTPRELSVMYNLASPSSVYVKKHRLKRKAQGKLPVSQTSAGKAS